MMNTLNQRPKTLLCWFATAAKLVLRLGSAALLIGLAALVSTGQAQDTKATKLTSQQLKFFETKIRPVLARECYSCHSTQVGAIKGGLWLDNQDGMLTGGDSGPAIVPHDLEESLLFNAINHVDFNMPPRKKLSDEIIADFKTWIEMGAPDPRVRKTANIKSKITKSDIAAGKKFWSFQAPQTVSVPNPTSDWGMTDIDQFIAQKLDELSLTPSSDADAATVLRRMTFRLTGLPPTLRQIEWLESKWATDRESALAQLVDEMLASPQFGERWGRHWLDTARYAESTGKERNVTFPYAWRYRDYVIDAFNQDKPYDQFVKEQLAGDLLPANTDEQWADNLIATGFLALGPKTLAEQNARQFDLDQIDEQIDVTTRVMLGVSVACARCHDHKFDPIPQTDYYALSGIFQSTSTHYGTTNSQQNRRPSNLLILPVDRPGPNDQNIRPEALAELKQKLASKQQELREAALQRRQARMNPGDSNTRISQQALRNFFRITTEVGVLQSEIDRYDENGDPYSVCMGVQEIDRPTNARLLERGEFDKPAQVVPRGFPQVLCNSPAKIPKDSSGRLEFAQWVGSDQNPLTARVMVNRVWLHLLGNGLVRTPENFGATGQLATHPELLDYLAVDFMKNDWSVKTLIRKIVLSRVFRMDSQFNQTAFTADPENKFLWRFEPKRLDAEALRDSLLAISGQLDTKRPIASMVGRAGTAAIREGNLIRLDGSSMNLRDRAQQAKKMSFRERRALAQEVQRRVSRIDTPSTYRSVYLPIVRDNLPRSLEAFDFAEPTMVIGQREQSNTPDQGLYFLNNEFVIQQCDAMAQRLIDEHDSVGDQIKQAFLLAFGRPATSGELRATSNFYRSMKSDSRGQRSRNDDLKRLSVICQGIVASAEFRFLE